MRETRSLAAALVTLFASLLLLGACHTAAGVGEDLSSAGRALKSTAEKHAP